ncbi:PPE family protein [Mycobacterium sp. HUMS_1102779]
MDFAAYPPEFNSARMYAGPGPGSLTTAAAAWNALAAELTSMATSYRAVLSALTDGPWAGPSSMRMAAAVAPYVSWMNATATQAQQTAGQLSSAVAAYETAFAATVPPPEIEVNRALLASLVSTNIMGQNTPAIASTEAQYAEMWAQDAHAMYGYAGASSSATTLTPFNAPPPTTTPAAATTQGAAATQTTTSAVGSSTQSTLSSVPNLLQGLSSGAVAAPGSNPIYDLLTSGPFNAFNNLSGLTVGPQILSEGLNFDASGAMLTLAPPVAAGWNPLIDQLSASTASQVSPTSPLDAGLGSSLVDSYGPGAGTPAGLGGPGVSAGLGRAVSVGKLSVPETWGSAPAIRLAATAAPLPAAGLEGVPQAGPGGFYGMPPMGPVASVVNAPRGDQGRLKAGARNKVIPELIGGSAMNDDPAARWAQPAPGAEDAAAVAERDELNQLRRAIADVSRQRDVLKRTAATLIKEGTNK